MPAHELGADRFLITVEDEGLLADLIVERGESVYRAAMRALRETRDSYAYDYIGLARGAERLGGDLSLAEAGVRAGDRLKLVVVAC